MTAINPQIEQLALTSNSLSISLEGATKIHQALGEYVDLDRDINADQIHLLSTQLLNQPGPPPPGTSTPALFSNIVTANATGPTTRLHSSRGSPPNVQIYTRQQPQSFDPTSNMQYQIPPIDEALARSAIRARQILLDPIDGNLVFPPSISHDESLDKLRNAIKMALAPNGHDDNVKHIL
ncbi:hypothetical protein F4604DRAFT_1690228 [Suillus subluteus]|nr:hypothetical protein F4604DRAFT_1690228 [Suillus subluteus]